MINVELNTRCTGLSEAVIVALGDALDGFGANVTYEYETGRLLVIADVAGMEVFVAMDQVIVLILNTYAEHLHYTYRVTREGILY